MYQILLYSVCFLHLYCHLNNILIAIVLTLSVRNLCCFELSQINLNMVFLR